MSITKMQTMNRADLAVDYLEFGRGGKKQKNLAEGTDRVMMMTCDLGSSSAFVSYAQSVATEHTRSVEVYHVVQAWLPTELDANSEADIARAHAAGVDLAARVAPDSVTCVVTHVDGNNGNVHNHVLIANHNVSTGKAYRGMSPIKLRKTNDEVMRDHNLAVFDSHASWPKKREEFARSKKTHDQFKVVLGDIIHEALNDPRSTNWESLLEVLGESGVDVEMRERKDDLPGLKFKMFGESTGRARRSSASKLCADFQMGGLLAQCEMNAQLAVPTESPRAPSQKQPLDPEKTTSPPGGHSGGTSLPIPRMTGESHENTDIDPIIDQPVPRTTTPPEESVEQSGSSEWSEQTASTTVGKTDAGVRPDTAAIIKSRRDREEEARLKVAKQRIGGWAATADSPLAKARAALKQAELARQQRDDEFEL